MKKFTVVFIFMTFLGFAYTPEFSVAGFFSSENSTRKNFNFNQGWRFFKGDSADCFKIDFNDSKWAAVNLPHGLELLPLNASGCVNYQGVAWYRKKFNISKENKNGQIFLYFEAIMGKSDIYLNGKKIYTNLGGYLPIVLNVSNNVNYDALNVVAVKTDNSNNAEYPPGKNQENLDFSYFGGIYRDTYLIVTDNIFITDSNYSGTEAGGGVFVSYSDVSKESAKATIKIEIENKNSVDKKIDVKVSLQNSSLQKEFFLKANSKDSINFELNIKNPKLWSLDDPVLSRLDISIFEDKILRDSVCVKTGIRDIKIDKSGLYLNGELMRDKLVGGNRHQDYAHIGNALPNSGQWRDAKKMKEAGMNIVRSAHYPMDPAFMDACDYFGLFVIVATPGWQFWNVKGNFEELVISDIRNMIRRDRNHPSVLFWEPILNETFYPVSFAKRAYNVAHAEFPYLGCYAVADATALGSDNFDIIYEHPFNNNFYKDNISNSEKDLEKISKNYKKITKPVFNREWGDNVDDWSSHNSPSRVAKEWGEIPQIKQMLHYSIPDYPYTCYNTLFINPTQFIGGALWHTFDHNRGYHPDSFWGGIFDAYRQPKYSYYMFKAQTNSNSKVPNVDMRPFVKILHELSPFSDSDIWVVSNCDEVELSIFGKNIGKKKTFEKNILSMKHKPIKFENCFDFMELKKLSREFKYPQIRVVANGYINGKKVASDIAVPSYRLEKITLKVDSDNVDLVADGSDFVPVVAYLADRKGTVKRYSNEYIKWTVVGEGKLIDDGAIGVNPVKTAWGEAVALIQSTTKQGEITVVAEVLKSGSSKPMSASITIQSVKPTLAINVYDSTDNKYLRNTENGVSFDKENFELKQKIKELQNEINIIKNSEVAKQQTAFEN